MTKVSIKISVDRTALKEKNTYDVACVRIEAVDDNGNRLPFYNDPLVLDAKGYIELIGPSNIAMSGGICGTYVKSKGRKGKGKLTVKTADGQAQSVEFTVEV